MEKNKKNIDDLFKEELGNYAETPPPAVWDALEKRLDAKPPIGPGSSRWGRYFFIASVVAVLGVSLLKVSGKLHSGDRQTAANTNAIAATENNTGTNNDNKNTAITIAASVSSVNSNTNPENANTSSNNQVTATNAAADGTISDNSIASNAAPVVGKHNNSGNISAAGEGNNGTKGGNKLADNGNSAAGNSRPTRHGRANANRTAGNNVAASNNTPGSAARNRRHGKQGGVNFVTNDNSQSESARVNNATVKTDESHYSSSAPKIAAITESNPAPVTEEPPALPGTFKETITEPIKQAVTNNGLKKTPELKGVPMPKIARLEAGIKAGYEGGFNSNAANKVVVSPYIEYKVGDKISVMVQPSIKYAHTTPQKLSGTLSFYKENNDSASGINVKAPVILTQGDTIGFNENYFYSQTHDSIVKSYTAGGTYMEFELPILLKYKLSPKLGAYGGVTMGYSSYASITEHTYTSAPILRYEVPLFANNATYTFVEYQATPVFAPVSSVITNSGNSINTYKGPLYSTQHGGLFRMGYMLGFNYEYSNRWLFDVLVQQSAAKSNVVGGYNTNAPFSAPYFRITLGYKILR